MSYSSSTPIMGLPQFEGTDVPSWLTDVNGAFSTIDQKYGAVVEQAEKASDDVNTQAGTLSTLQAQVDKMDTDLQTTTTQSKNNTTSINALSQNLGATQGGVNALFAVTTTPLTASANTTLTVGNLQTNGFSKVIGACGSISETAALETYGPYTYIVLASLPGNPLDLAQRPELCSTEYQPDLLPGFVVAADQVLPLYIFYDGTNTQLCGQFSGVASALQGKAVGITMTSINTTTIQLTQAVESCPITT